MSKEIYLKALELFEKGNFQDARKTLIELKASGPGNDIMEKCDNLLKKLGSDRAEIIIGLVSLLLLSFLYVFFGLLR